MPMAPTKFKIYPRDQFVTTNWINGGGLTHEIARSPGSGGSIWRLSVAEVTKDGPFSHFRGMSRILTVVEGAGQTLTADNLDLAATLCKPVRFSGDIPVRATLINGPVRNFNVIYDGAEIKADVRVLRPGAKMKVPARKRRICFVYCVAGGFTLNGTAIAAGDACSLGAENVEIVLPKKSTALLVTLDGRDSSN